MTATIDPERWLKFIRAEYLDAFIKEGGSSIKFAVPFDAASKTSIIEGVRKSAEASGYLVAQISAEDTRIHMIDQLFFRIADQMPWPALSQRVINKLAVAAHYAPAPDGTEPLVDRIAAANHLEADFVRMEIRPKIEGRVTKCSMLARDFRVAASQLCLAELAGDAGGESMTEAITDWLTGRNKAIAAVKPYQIFTRIHRTNARYLLASLLRWVRFAGHAGVVIVIDMERVLVPSNPRDGTVFYTKAAMFEAYEVLRQFIDATDEMKGLLMVLVPSREFVDPDSPRGIGVYEALKFRVYDEVHDQRLVNPMTSLVRIKSSGGAP